MKRQAFSDEEFDIFSGVEGDLMRASEKEPVHLSNIMEARV